MMYLLRHTWRLCFEPPVQYLHHSCGSLWSRTTIMLINKLHKHVRHRLIAMLDVVQFNMLPTPAREKRVESLALYHLEVMDASTEECADALLFLRLWDWLHKEDITSVRCINIDIMCIHHDPSEYRKRRSALTPYVPNAERLGCYASLQRSSYDIGCVVLCARWLLFCAKEKGSMDVQEREDTTFQVDHELPKAAIFLLQFFNFGVNSHHITPTDVWQVYCLHLACWCDQCHNAPAVLMTVF